MATENVVYIDFNTQPIYEIGSILVATLCYSAPGDTDDQREKAVTALCAWGLRSRAQVDRDWANSNVPIKPCYAVQSLADVDRMIQDVDVRLNDRFAAGRIVMPFLQKSFTGELPLVGKTRMKPTVNKLVERELPSTGEGDAENFKRRIWSPARNVLHLAGAYEFLRYEHATQGHQLGFSTMLWDAGFIGKVVRVAQDLERVIAKSFADRDLRIDPATLIRVRTASKLSRSEPRSLADPETQTSTGDDIAHDTPKENPRAAG